MIDQRTAEAVWDLASAHCVEFEDGDHERDRPVFAAFCAQARPGDQWPVTALAVGPKRLDRLFKRRYLYFAHLVADEAHDIVLHVSRRESGALALEAELNPLLRALQEPVKTKPYRRRRLSPLAGRLSS
jgi:hypothetical protein